MMSSMFKIKTILTVSFILLGLNANAQNNACAGVDPVNNVINPKIINLILTDHTTIDPNNQAVITDYTLQVLLTSKPISSVTMAKNAFTLLAGIPANCYTAQLPNFTGVNNNVLYKLGLTANGPAGSSTMGVTTQSFFLQGVPSAPASIRMAMLDILSKLWDRVFSTENTKPWFRPIGK